MIIFNDLINKRKNIMNELCKYVDLTKNVNFMSIWILKNSLINCKT